MNFLSALKRFSFAQSRGCHFLKWNPNRSLSVERAVLLGSTTVVTSNAGVDERKRKPAGRLDGIRLTASVI